MHELCWKNHMFFVLENISNLYKNNLYVDCTVHAEGQSLHAHKVVLAAVSPYFDRMLQEDPQKISFVLEDVKYQNLKSVFDFIYYGAVHISSDELLSFLKVAELLQLRITSDDHQLEKSVLTVEKKSNYVPLYDNKNLSENECHGTEDVPNAVPSRHSSGMEERVSDALAAQSLPYCNSSDGMIGSDKDAVSYDPGAIEIGEFPTQEISGLRGIDSGQFPAAPSATVLDNVQVSETASTVKIGKHCIEFGDGTVDPVVTERGPQCSEQNTSGDFNKFDSKTASDRPNRCNLCKNYFASFNALRKHKKLKHFAQKQCAVCKIYFTRDKFKKHLLTHAKPYPCEECGVRYGIYDELYLHVKECHADSWGKNQPCSGTLAETPHTCHLCDRTFAVILQLRQHQKSHRLDRCGVCLVSFTSVKVLDQHVQTHSKPFTCAQCPSQFEKYCHLRSHVRVKHAPLRCDVCRKGFASLASLDQHRRTHAGKQPNGETDEARVETGGRSVTRFSCLVCKKLFRTEKGVRDHVVTHGANFRCESWKYI